MLKINAKTGGITVTEPVIHMVTMTYTIEQHIYKVMVKSAFTKSFMGSFIHFAA